MITSLFQATAEEAMILLTGTDAMEAIRLLALTILPAMIALVLQTFSVSDIPSTTNTIGRTHVRLAFMFVLTWLAVRLERTVDPTSVQISLAAISVLMRDGMTLLALPVFTTKLTFSAQEAVTTVVD